MNTREVRTLGYTKAHGTTIGIYLALLTSSSFSVSKRPKYIVLVDGRGDSKSVICLNGFLCLLRYSTLRYFRCPRLLKCAQTELLGLINKFIRGKRPDPSNKDLERCLNVNASGSLRQASNNSTKQSQTQLRREMCVWDLLKLTGE